MKILVVEHRSEDQALLARKIESIDSVDRDTLDLSISLANELTFLERAADFDVVLLGAGLADQSPLLSSKARQVAPETEVLVLLPEREYMRGAFRAVLARGARKVFSVSAPLVDIVQELMCILEEHRVDGKVSSGKVIALLQAKGGVGVTSICAALAEVCSSFGQRTMLWDLDIETRDLCRALATQGDQPSVVTGWLDGTIPISRESLKSALVRVSPSVSILPPPDSMGAAVDLVGRVDAIELIQSVINLARVTHDNIIIDLGGRVGPAAGAILRQADQVVVLVDDSVLGLSAARFFLATLRSVVKNLDTVTFLCSGTSIPKNQISEHIERDHRFGFSSWRLPVIPFDAAAARWPGSGNTLYSLGKRATRRAIEDVASELQLIRTIERKPVQLLPWLGGRTGSGVSAYGQAHAESLLSESMRFRERDRNGEGRRSLWDRMASSFTSIW